MIDAHITQPPISMTFDRLVLLAVLGILVEWLILMMSMLGLIDSSGGCSSRLLVEAPNVTVDLFTSRTSLVSATGLSGRWFLAGTAFVRTGPGVLLMASNFSLRSTSSGTFLLILKLSLQISTGGGATPDISLEVPLSDVWPGVSFVGLIPSDLICGIL